MTKHSRAEFVRLREQNIPNKVIAEHVGLSEKRVSGLASELGLPLRSRSRHGTVSPEQVIEATAKFFNSSPEEITDYCRSRRIVHMRQIAMFLAVEAGNSLPVTGKAFGRDHTTVHHAHRTVERSKQLKAQAVEIAMLLENGG